MLVQPEQRQGHQQRHDNYLRLQEATAHVVCGVIPIEADLLRDRRGIAQLWRLPQSTGIGTVEGGSAVHPHTDRNRYLPAAKPLWQTKCRREPAIRGYPMIRNLSELTDPLAVDKHLVCVVEAV